MAKSMAVFKAGILSRPQLQAAIKAGIITASKPIEDLQVQPASLDLRLGATAWRVRASFLPGTDASLAQKIDRLAMHRIDLRDGAVLEKGCVYIAELMEALDLPDSITAITNPKSSTGRLDIFTRMITDKGDAFEIARPGYKGAMYAEISPRSFSILARQGSRLSQLRLRAGGGDKSATASSDLTQALTPIYGKQQAAVASGDGVALGVHLQGGMQPNMPDLVGWRARKNAGLIDIDGRGKYRAAEFWEAVTTADLIDGGLVLHPDEFYILASHEYVTIPKSAAAEMTAYDTRIGEFRAHYAGFFDPGFGMAELAAGETRAVLEVRSHDVPFLIEEGQTVCRVVYEMLSADPEILYGESGSHYQAQGLKLSKHFKEPTA